MKNTIGAFVRAMPLGLTGIRFVRRVSDLGSSMRSSRGRTARTARGRAPCPAADHAALQERYRRSPLSGERDSFILFRILGNDLEPRHKKGQTRENLRFILDNEEAFPACEKRFVVNRMVDAKEEEGTLQLLEDAGLEYIHEPFKWSEWCSTSWDCAGLPEEYAAYRKGFGSLDEAQQLRALLRLYRLKNNYVMNNNGARNLALRAGRGLAKWVLPWDGNCFLTRSAWEELVEGILSNAEYPYHVVPMARTARNSDLLDLDYRPIAEDEPQIVFRRDAQLEFDQDYAYGRRPKVELLWRLGVPGPWDDWRIEPWDLPCPAYASEAGAFARCGWVARLSSGEAKLEAAAGFADRGMARAIAIKSLLDRLDERRVRASLVPASPVFYKPSSLAQLRDRRDRAPANRLAEALRNRAEDALGRGPYSVIDKTTFPPSGNPHDYWHPAPYYWPNPIPLPGLPYIRRDGRRVPGTRLYEPLSDQYDRTRAQRLFDDTLVLTLASEVWRDERYALHAASLVRRWFIDQSTAMTPSLEYAQVRRGYDGNRGSSSGIIEFKDLYYFLDAVRLLERDGLLTSDEQGVFRAWMTEYLGWLQDSAQGRKERAGANNHGTYYDLQVGAIAAYLGDTELLRVTLRDSQCRLLRQFAEEGSQPQELKRTTTAHYCCFNLQGWVHLVMLAVASGEPWLERNHPVRQRLQSGMRWLLSHQGKSWPYRQIEAFDEDRYEPVLVAYNSWFGERFGEQDKIKPVFFPHDGIPPFWQFMHDEVAAA